MKKLTILFSLLISVATVFAQQRITVSGTITEAATGNPIPGVTVLVKGTTTGTVTNVDGQYTIEATGDAVLTFSFVGMESQDIAVNNRTNIDVSMQPSTQQVDEVVVVGYGKLNVKDLTSSIATVKSDELVKTPTGQAMQALQGKVAGVQIINSGAPGGAPTVRIRGIGSFPGSSDSSPLYVVDGVYFDNIDFLNPSDIQTLSVLKDASAAAIYGVRAANGVVLITTKKGTLNTKSQVSYDGYIGVQVPQNVLKMANAEQFVNYVNQTGAAADISYIANAMQRYGRSRINPNVPDVNTDWYKEIMHSASRQQNHSLSITGGDKNTDYSLGMSYFEQQGLLKTKNSYERLNLRGNLDQEVNNWLKVGLNLNLSNGIKYIADDGAWFAAYHAVPVLPVYDQDNYDQLTADNVAYASNYASAQLLGYRGAQNPFFNLAYTNHRQDIKKVYAGAYSEISIIPQKLTFKTDYNVSWMFLRDRNVGLPYYVTTNTNRPLSTLTTSRTLQANKYLDNVLTYTDKFGRHNVTAMAGTSYRDEWYDWLKGYAEDVPLQPNSWYIGQSRSEDSKTVDDNAERIYGMSYFGRIAYNYGGKYLAYFTLRREGTSKYQEKWGTFPAFGLGWVVSEENFFKNVRFINYLKLRGGWGRLGNDKIARQDGANTTTPVYIAVDDTKTDGTTTTSTFGYLGWEIVEGKNAGLSARLFDSRLNIESDYYIRDTKDAAIPVLLKLQPGSVLKNVGVIRNSGFELSLTWNDQISKDLSYTIGANISTLKNEVRDLYGQQYLDGGSAEFRQRSQVGEPLLSFYGYQVAGVYQNQAEIDADPIATDNGLVPGDFKFVDQNNDQVIDDNDKVFLGSYFPDLTYGANLGLTYKNIEFSMSIMGQRGNKILNRKRGEIIWTNDTNIDADLANGLWHGEGTSNKYPSAAALRRGWDQNFSDYLLEDGSFFRIQNVQLAYNIKGSKLLGAGMPDARVYVTAEKPLTVFNYNGFSPEVPNGIDRQFYPVPAVYTIGLNLKF
ncbi:SusC/RagA family TonB-linked outer membrane protein [Prolixibacter denitrificans]|uniref:SusC/RagA family TonB-linked outer membrane protein n=1 Tax=Prolixibacter denitrificans TaxID=1541063 RepID=A0A2P8CFE9_9BACT|nr:TonB-dependent receptor [Prolixibacter denitrificans]PSK83713.1 TonB-linked SusC/RagA family outer membrane protein [Prolixibacter denitrificans]GET23257.1 SusC/RagA family TonB-linked outer membrane protein [Prolixibacter denitrificans]